MQAGVLPQIRHRLLMCPSLHAVLQLPAGFRFEPLHLAKGGVVALTAGSVLPETSVSVVNGAGNRVVKALIAGQRQQLKVVSTCHLASCVCWVECLLMGQLHMCYFLQLLVARPSLVITAVVESVQKLT